MSRESPKERRQHPPEDELEGSIELEAGQLVGARSSVYTCTHALHHHE